MAENIFMSQRPVTKAETWTGKDDGEARGLLDSIGADISGKAALVSTLSVGQMQMVEIAKALSFESDIIIMDEPTSALTEKEVDNLFAIIDGLKKKRCGDRLYFTQDGRNHEDQ